MKLLLLTLLISQSTFSAYKMELVLDKQDIVWGMDFIDNNTIIYTEKSGNIKTIDLTTKKITEIKGSPKVYTRGQAGLLDIKLHPKFSENKGIYITYSKELENGKTTALAYATLDGNQLKDFKELFVGKGESNARVHFGSRITFSEDGKLFFGIGDRGDRSNAQSLANHFGKIMRLNLDGSVPKDNPFVGQKDAMPEIWSFGHRNPQGLVYVNNLKKLYEMEHGPRGGDEINIVEKGKNYGWPKQSYGQEYAFPISVGEEKVKGTEQPVKYYVPSIAPCGLVYYEGNRYPKLKNALLAGALKLTHINVYHPESGKEERIFEDKDMRIRSLSISPDDFIYFSTDGGKIYKLIP